MPSQQEYEQLLDQAMGGILGMAVETRSGVAKLCAEARRRVMRERNIMTKGISTRWRDEFAKIKNENDEWQKALNAAYHSAMQSIDESAGDMIERLQR